MEKQKTNKREWVKTAIIVFLAIMLVLTFFSNTIMNRSLPEVAAQYVQSGTINARIRGNGTISANETYDVTLSQTRKVRSVMVRVGDEVQAGDVLLTLEPMESEELKQAQDALADMELNYQKSLIDASNGSASENHEIKRLQDKYNEALAVYQLYSNDDPEILLIQLEKAELEQQRLEQQKTDTSNDLARAQQNKDYLEAQAQITSIQAKYDAAVAEYDGYMAEKQGYDQLLADIETLEKTRIDINGYTVNDYQLTVLYDEYDEFLLLVNSVNGDLQLCATNLEYFVNRIPSGSYEDAKRLQHAYSQIDPIIQLQKQLPDSVALYQLEQKMNQAMDEIVQADADLSWAKHTVETHENMINGIQDNLDQVTSQLNSQMSIVATMTKAKGAADALKMAEQALEDKLFEVNLGDPSSLDMQHAKEAIEIQKQLIEALSVEADGQEIKSNVAGVVSTIHTSAGNTVGAETPVVTITIADRGYTLQIPVTTDQARKVTIGDTAEITNYWNGDITATLENILNDPQNPNGGKILMFRINGDSVEPGSNLTLSIGQRSANYDTLIPNSAVRTDANGTFVLVVVAKSSPLGNRYVAQRADVQVLASDDTTSAVSGLANGDFVITTSTAPIEAGSQIRLVDNG